MPSGGSRPGAGAPKGNRNGERNGRQWIRSIVDDERRRQEFVQALDKALAGPAEAGVAAYLRAFEHGYGRPPQALDVRHGPLDGEGPIEFHMRFEDGSAADRDPLPATPAVPEGADS